MQTEQPASARLPIGRAVYEENSPAKRRSVAWRWSTPTDCSRTEVLSTSSAGPALEKLLTDER